MDEFGLATVALAVFTAALALATWLMARATRAQVERAHRPVLVPYQRHGAKVPYRGREILADQGPWIVETRDLDQALTSSTASQPVENIGMGPALNVRGNFRGGPVEGSNQSPTEGIAAGACGVVAFEAPQGESLVYEPGSKPEAIIYYDDVAGTTYCTRATFDADINAYASEVEAKAISTWRAWWRIARGEPSP